jgi:aminoglycoside phosphotransferase (APT) family kinase protein
MLTGEFTPFNLLAEGAQLSGMIDFGDGLVGPREYDWLGPLCFFVEGQATRRSLLRRLRRCPCRATSATRCCACCCCTATATCRRR